jgi:hypothetical protein
LGRALKQHVPDVTGHSVSYNGFYNGHSSQPKGDLGRKILRTLETKNVQALFAGDIDPKRVPMKCHMRPLSGNTPLVRPRAVVYRRSRFEEGVSLGTARPLVAMRFEAPVMKSRTDGASPEQWKIDIILGAAFPVYPPPREDISATARVRRIEREGARASARQYRIPIYAGAKGVRLGAAADELLRFSQPISDFPV